MQIEIKKKKITFKNPITHEIVTEIEMPQFIRLVSINLSLDTNISMRFERAWESY